MPISTPARRLRQLSAALFLASLPGAGTLPYAVEVGAQQAAPVTGTLVGVVRQDGQPVPDVQVTLHRVDSRSSGEVATARSGTGGDFRFPIEPSPDAAFTVYFVTADHFGVRFFGPPLHPEEAMASEYSLAVHDTASVLPDPVRVSRRDMVVIPDTDGSWEFNEVIRIVNPTGLALTSAGGMPTWEFPIPVRAADFEAGECAFQGGAMGVLPHEISQMDARVLLLAPIIPGPRDLCIRYRIPASPAQAQIPLEAETDTLNLFVLQPSHLTSVEGLSSARMIDAEGERFLLYSALDLQPGASVDLRWSGAGSSPVDPLIAALVVTLGLLAVGVWAALRNRSVPHA